ncbi:MAG: hypothetical protein JST26_05385 [Bacteroidetes bacterium]|nr:hypothetical protein [Bacteroidota bacterium]
MKKKKYIVWISLVILAGAGYWFYHHLMDSKEPFHDPKYYRAELDTIRAERMALRSHVAGVQQLKSKFMQQISKRVFAYWYGTKWDFNGTTETPQTGSIACGYFVTTTLRDMGVPINRVKMAQCASEEMIRSLTTKPYIYHLSGMSLADFENKLAKKGDGLYIVGLDNHTGFLWFSGEEHFFIHSTGWFPFKVVKDKICESSVLAKSNYRVVGRISDDADFLKRWVNAD